MLRSTVVALVMIGGCERPQEPHVTAALPPGADTLPYYSATKALPVCEASKADTAGWQLIGGSGFRLKIPAAFEQQEMQGIDSEVGEWRDSTTSLHYDQGWYSNDLTYLLAAADGLRMCRLQLGSRDVRVALYQEKGSYIAAAHLPDIGQGDGLTLEFFGGSAQDQKTALTAFRTLELKHDDR
jgi:hypothetical protein